MGRRAGAVAVGLAFGFAGCDGSRSSDPGTNDAEGEPTPDAAAEASSDVSPDAGSRFPGAIIGRAAWGARPWACTDEAIAYAPRLTFAVIHHTACCAPATPADSAAAVRSIQDLHVDGNGWCDIGYHFLVDPWGRVFEGRAGGIDRPVIGAQAGGFNVGSTGIAFLGTYEAAPPSAAALDAATALLAWKLRIEGVDPAMGFTTTAGDHPSQRVPPGTVVSFPSPIIGHRDVDDTECPGGALYAALDALRLGVIAATGP